MFSKEEIEDLKLLTQYNEQVTLDFCKLSIESAKDNVDPKIIISAANKLGVTPVQVEKVITALLNVLYKTAEKNIKVEELEENLLQSEFTSAVSKAIGTTYTENSIFLKEWVEKMSIKIPQYHGLEWRFDILTKTRTLNNIVEPLITLQLQIDEEGAGDIKAHHLQIDPSTLSHVTESLEEALHQARSHHVRKFKKKRKPN